MERPYVICHMLTSIDGKVTGDFLFRDECSLATELYYGINRDYNADAYACGRITMEGSFSGGYYPDLSEYNGVNGDNSDHAAKYSKKFFAVAFDPHARLGWKNSVIEDEDIGYGDAHIIEVLTESVDPRFTAYLKEIGVSYIFAGKTEIDVKLALFKLRRIFGIEKLLLEGGSIINGAFEREGLVDEISLVVSPVIAAADDKPLFMNSTVLDFDLIEAKVHDNAVVWLNYKKIDRG